MNNIDKQISARTKKKYYRKIWRKMLNFHGINFYWWCFPLGVLATLFLEHKERKYKRLEWSEKKAAQMANKYFGKLCEIDENNILYYNIAWDTKWLWKNVARRKDWPWLNKYALKMNEYIEKDFEIEGYVKIVNDECYGEKWITFEKRA